MNTVQPVNNNIQLTLIKSMHFCLPTALSNHWAGGKSGHTMRLPCIYYEPTMIREAQTKPPCINHAQAKRCSKDTMRRLHGKRNVELNAKRALHKKKGTYYAPTMRKQNATRWTLCAACMGSAIINYVKEKR